MKHLQKICSLK